MNRRVRETAVAGLFVFAVSYLLVEPGSRFWGPITGQFGEFGLIAALLAACVGCGAVFTALTGVRFDAVLTGGAVVYTLWLISLEATAGPFDSPVHILLGAFLLTGFVVGAWLAERIRR